MLGLLSALAEGGEKAKEVVNPVIPDLPEVIWGGIAFFLLLILMNWVLLGDPFQWVTAQNGVIQVNTTGALQAITTDVGGSLGDLFEVTLGVAPLALVAGFLLIIGSFLKKDATGWGLLAVGLCIAAFPVIRAVAADEAVFERLAVGGFGECAEPAIEDNQRPTVILVEAGFVRRMMYAVMRRRI